MFIYIYKNICIYIIYIFIYISEIYMCIYIYIYICIFIYYLLVMYLPVVKLNDQYSRIRAAKATRIRDRRADLAGALWIRVSLRAS